jgi:hypothetical protein
MMSDRRVSWLPAKLLLVTLLFAAQSGALAHAFEHDAGTLQTQACAICVTVGQLDSSCVAALGINEIEDCYSCQPIARAAILKSLQAPVARQRGPPSSL